ncbi:hypothetical protein Goklo_023024 [Gossypium klotzschianum]|uniref:Uncharacterized protein n=1 Tax=Gossypium klotzschianum TaxID=34286 RepID=A0A7J8TPG7_9ROSI|nr:hypothetical protein [Gossypium klotzschianum]
MASSLDTETKKVRFKERDGDADVDMVVDLDSQPKVSWKQMLIEKRVSEQEEGFRSSEVECTEDFEFLEGDVQKNYCQWYSGYRVFGSHTIDLVQGYGTMVVLKLPKGDFRKIKEIIGHNKVGGGPGSLTNGADLGKHSAVVFKKDSNSKKGQVLGIGGDDGVGKVVFILKAQDLSDKGGTS